MDIFFKTMKTPGKMACEKCISVAGQALANRTWKDVKNYVYNMNVSRKRKFTKKKKKKKKKKISIIFPFFCLDGVQMKVKFEQMILSKKQCDIIMF